MDPAPLPSSRPRPRLVRSVGRAVGRLAALPVDRALGWTALERLHERARAEGLTGAAFLEATLADLGVGVATGEAADAALAAVPGEGPLVVLANLPFGGVEALAVLARLLTRRPDTRVLADRGLLRLLGAEEFALPLVGGRALRTVRGDALPEHLEPARTWLEAGGALLVFPGAGGRASVLPGDGGLDGAWSLEVGRLVEATRPAVLPVHVGGRPGGLATVTRAVSPRLRAALLPRELLGRRGSTLGLTFGRPLEPGTWGRYAGAENLMGYLRLATYALEAGGGGRRGARRPAEPSEPAPLAAPEDPAALAAEVAGLAADRRLQSAGDLDVWLAAGHEAPAVLRELGRLREATFRAVGEGTGRARDLDAHDEHYEHLFLWDRAAHRIVGAYRLGRTDRLLAAFGRRGLYTSTLFQYRRRFLEELGPALELGRAFVVAEQQRGHLPLLLLWQGIGRFVAAHPRYATLFGPVSISADYTSVTRHVMARRLLAAGAGRPPARGNFRVSGRTVVGVDLESLVDLAGSVEELGRLVADIDPEGKGIPVLLRQYLKLNGRVLAFNVDDDFGGALDALLVLDLRDSDERTLRRYLGAEGLATFQAHQAREGLVAG